MSHDFVDLRFSSEDESHLPVFPAPSESRTSRSNHISDFRFSDDDILSESRPDAFASEQPFKKRKLSSPSFLIAAEDEIFGTRRRVPLPAEDLVAHDEPQQTNKQEEFDEILFTSSPQIQVRPRKSIEKAASRPQDDVLELVSSSPPPTKTTNFSTTTAALLAEISQSSTALRKPIERKLFEKKAFGTKKAQSGRADKRSKTPDFEIGTQPRKIRLTSVEREAKNQGKELERARRAKAQEGEKEKRRLKTEADKETKKLEKEQRVREKQIAADLAEVNKARWDKKVSAPEMIVDLPASIDGKSVDTQVRDILKRLDIETTNYVSLLPDIIKWRRKVSSVFNEELGHWQRAPLTIQNEKHVLCLINGRSFVAMVCGDVEEDESIEAHVAKVKGKFRGSSVIYLIEGLDILLKKDKNAKNRSFQAAVRSQGIGASAGAGDNNERSLAKTGTSIDPDAIEDALLRLQVIHGCKIYHTAIPAESAEWIASFTQHISTIPYKYHPFPLLTVPQETQMR